MRIDRSAQLNQLADSFGDVGVTLLFPAGHSLEVPGEDAHSACFAAGVRPVE